MKEKKAKMNGNCFCGNSIIRTPEAAINDKAKIMIRFYGLFARNAK